jgi:S1-C subfamily serine protease
MQSTSIIRRLILLSLVSSAVVVAQSAPKDDVYTVVKETGSKPMWTVIYSGHPASGKTPGSPKVRYILEFSNECLSKDLKNCDCNHLLTVGQTFGYYDYGFGSPTTAGNQTIVKVDERADEFTITEVRNNDTTHSVSHLYKIARVEVETQTSSTAPTRKDIPAIAKAANPAIVTIITAAGDKPITQGTGFIVSADGVIVTNYHVIKEGNKAIAKFSDGAVLPVDGVLAADKHRDLAIIKIQGKFRTLNLGNSDRVQVGEEVVAIGNPLGLELTVSNGIVSGLRTDKEAGGKFLQTTAPISPGSSGGPLFNMLGEVIGINTMYLEGGENLNFAIPINDAKLLLRNLSARVQKLPDEPETETSKVKTEAQGQEQACNEQATKFEHFNTPGGDVTEFVSQFSHGRCFVEIGSYEMVKQERFYDGSRFEMKDVSPYPVWAIHIYDASSEGEKVPLYGWLYFGREQRMKCHIVPTGRAPDDDGIVCRSKEEFDDLALKHFGIPQLTKIVPTTLTRIAPTNVPSNALPPNMKMAAASPDGSGTQEQLLEDIKYCYKNPANRLQLSDGEIVSCEEMNSSIEAREKECKGKNPKTNPQNCKSFLKTFKDLKAGRL